MQFMMFPKANKETEAGVMPSDELPGARIKHNDELMKAGVLVDLAGLRSTSKNARIKFSRDKVVTVVDGPFAETKEWIG